MKEKFEKYLADIGVPERMHERIESIYEFYENICPEEIVDIFIGDSVEDTKANKLENLWFFSDKYLMEAKSFMMRDNFDMALVKGRIVYWELAKKDYDFQKAKETSHFHLLFKINTGVTGDIYATGKNCDYLKEIMDRYVMANLEK